MKVLSESEMQAIGGGNPVVIGMALGAATGGINAALAGKGATGILTDAGLGAMISVSAGIAATGALGAITFGTGARVVQGINTLGLSAGTTGSGKWSDS